MQRRAFLSGMASAGICGVPELAKAAESDGPLRLSSALLYQPSQEFEARLSSPQHLSNYMKAVIKAASDAIGQQPKGPGFSGQIVVLFKPVRKARYWVMSKSPERLKPYEEAMIQALHKVDVPPVFGGPLAFALLYDVWEGGAGYTNDGMVIPEQWVKALPPTGGYIDDALFGKLWPDGQ
ncbi:hypothetical protein PQU92_02945 [Asticcacaulis sp. BYS171W]|uniref:Tat pathway signal protein n=1 Tax=Asticcacaulis aquaticus TaxID=2984212 RepID=A0ABT5HQ95_9CAUL|nr:hypothetical protein [Asticcacaulis aquaticus]MDC7682216.1 hypothetical protein [Asticcacaulis aquaticus]